MCSQISVTIFLYSILSVTSSLLYCTQHCHICFDFKSDISSLFFLGKIVHYPEQKYLCLIEERLAWFLKTLYSLMGMTECLLIWVEQILECHCHWFACVLIEFEQLCLNIFPVLCSAKHAFVVYNWIFIIYLNDIVLYSSSCETEEESFE